MNNLPDMSKANGSSMDMLEQNDILCFMGESPKVYNRPKLHIIIVDDRKHRKKR